MIPSSMKATARWLVWQLVGDKKLPKDWRTPHGTAIDSTNEAYWTSYAEAQQAAQQHGLGVGFALGDEWAGVDLDDVRDPATGQLTPEALAIVTQLDSYAEVSPSGTGVKIFVNAWLGKNHKRTGLEIYGHGRYFTVTGQHLEGTPVEPQPRTERLAELIDQEFAATTTKCTHRTRSAEPIIIGGRNNTLTRKAGSMRRQGFDEPAILAALLQHNAHHCDPPLSQREVETIARSISRKEPAADLFPLTETGDAEFLAACFGSSHPCHPFIRSPRLVALVLRATNHEARSPQTTGRCSNASQTAAPRPG